jgi:hypothetical protein
MEFQAAPFLRLIGSTFEVIGQGIHALASLAERFKVAVSIELLLVLGALLFFKVRSWILVVLSVSVIVALEREEAVLRVEWLQGLAGSLRKSGFLEALDFEAYPILVGIRSFFGI